MEKVGLAPEQTHAEGVKRTDSNPLSRLSRQGRDSLLHLPRRLVREGDSQDVVRADVSYVDQVGDTMREDARLATAGTGEDEHRPVAVRHRLTLWLVEGIEDAADLAARCR